ncbi:MAG: DUF262 domain-containing HNH endonuclease family protein [Devosia sp.]
MAKIDFDMVGIGQLLRSGRLRVPPNQRSYKWEEEHITDLFQDLAKAIDGEDYFLGTIVLTDSAGAIPEVTDGQQRLATTSILLAAIRDFYLGRGETKLAGQLEAEFLSFTEYRTHETVPRLTLNTDDAQFFTESILQPPEQRPEFDLADLSESNRRLANALTLASAHVAKITSQFRETDMESVLARWIDFLRDKALVMQIKVPDASSAYRMFATLNDRGLRASQADLIKNFLFGKAGSRLTEAATKWSAMSGAIETVGDDELVILYLRHLWVSKNGPTKEDDLAEAIEDKIKGTQTALGFLRDVDESASHYVALFNPEHSKWNGYKTVIRSHVRTIYQDLKVEQIRPLLFAISRHFSPAEAVKAFQLCVNWSVRFLVAGGRGGFLDRHYGLRAQEIGVATIRSANDLADAMREFVPNDALFEAAFAKASVTQSSLARYYLRTIDAVMSGETEPEWVANPETEVVNLEHIMPKVPDDNWDIDPDIAAANVKRIGNMVLMQATPNVALGNAGFSDKKKEYAKSSFAVTAGVSAHKKWGIAEIDARQAKLAKVAVTAWPIDLRKSGGRKRK